MNNKNILSDLSRACYKYFCCISRSTTSEDITAIPISCNENTLLLAEYDESYSFIGYSIIWIRDIVNYVVYDSNVFFQYRVKSKLNVAPCKIHIKLNDIFHELERKVPLVIIMKRLSHESIVWVGNIQRITPKMIYLNELDTEAHWLGIHCHKVNSISKVIFGDHYSRALWAIASEVKK